MKNTFKIVLIIVALSLVMSCGGGGKSSDPSSPVPAVVYVNVSPDKINNGDRTTVSVTVEDVNELGIMLKVRFPSNLKYVSDSAELLVKDQPHVITPAANKTKDTSTYLVFFFRQSDFGRDNYGKVVFILKANAGVKDGLIEVDATIDDPLISNSSEFNIKDPKFVADDETGINVIAEETPVPSPTPTA